MTKSGHPLTRCESLHVRSDRIEIEQLQWAAAERGVEAFRVRLRAIVHWIDVHRVRVRVTLLMDA